MTLFDSFVNGLLLSAIASLLSSAIALWRFGRTYHLSVLLSAFAAVYVLAAWVIYTKKNPVNFGLTKPPNGDTRARDDDEPSVIGERGSERSGRVRSFLKNPIPALLWSALQLAVLTAVLYAVFDIGATYYR